jgi:hypothetical protein
MLSPKVHYKERKMSQQQLPPRIVGHLKVEIDLPTQMVTFVEDAVSGIVLVKPIELTVPLNIIMEIAFSSATKLLQGASHAVSKPADRTRDNTLAFDANGVAKPPR